MRAGFNQPIIHCRDWQLLVIATAFAFSTLSMCAQHPGNPGNPGHAGPARPAPPPARPPAPAPRALPPTATGRPESVDRYSHGSVRHSETQVVPHVDTERHFQGQPGQVHRNDYVVHRDFDADFHRHFHYNDFAFHRFVPALPLGFLTLQVGGVPYYYSDGIYYQPMASGYQEVYPPVGAAVAQPPDGSIPVAAGGQTYYYAGGAFYLLQPDGSYQIAPTPIGVIVPELPPGAVQVALNDGSVAYQFNGIYYQPVFVNGITQYQTIIPQPGF